MTQSSMQHLQTMYEVATSSLVIDHFKIERKHKESKASFDISSDRTIVSLKLHGKIQKEKGASSRGGKNHGRTKQGKHKKKLNLKLEHVAKSNLVSLSMGNSSDLAGAASLNLPHTHQ